MNFKNLSDMFADPSFQETMRQHMLEEIEKSSEWLRRGGGPRPFRESVVRLPSLNGPFDRDWPEFTDDLDFFDANTEIFA